jgi:two-component system chemotaxis response regulator CheY
MRAAFGRHQARCADLVISSLSDKATTIQAMKNGAKGFLTKPFDDEQINAALEELIEEAQG